MFSLITLPFKLAALVFVTALSLLRGALGLIGFLLNPFVLLCVALVAAYLYFT